MDFVPWSRQCNAIQCINPLTNLFLWTMYLSIQGNGDVSQKLSGVQFNSIHEMSDLWRNQHSQWVRHANIHLKNYLQLSLKGCEWNGIISTQHCGNIRSTACTFVQRDVWEPEASLRIRTWCWKRNSKNSIWLRQTNQIWVYVLKNTQNNSIQFRCITSSLLVVKCLKQTLSLHHNWGIFPAPVTFCIYGCS